MKNTILGFGSFFFPIVIILAIIAAMALPFFVDIEDEISEPLRPAFVICMILLFLSVLASWFFIIYDIIHAATNPNLSSGAKAGWICVIWFLNIFVFGLYWYKHIRTVNHEIQTDIETNI